HRVVDHWLHFSVKMRGNAREKFFTAPAPGLGDIFPSIARYGGDVVFQANNNVIHSAWAELAYVLVPTGTTVNPSVVGGAGTPLHALYRCQYVVFPDTSVMNDRAVVVGADGSPFTNVAGIPHAMSSGKA